MKLFSYWPLAKRPHFLSCLNLVQPCLIRVPWVSRRRELSTLASRFPFLLPYHSEALAGHPTLPLFKRLSRLSLFWYDSWILSRHFHSLLSIFANFALQIESLVVMQSAKDCLLVWVDQALHSRGSSNLVGNDHSRKEKRLPYRTRQYARTGLHGQLNHLFDLQVDSWRLRVPSLKVEAHRFEDEDGWSLPACTWLLRGDY